MAQIIDQLQTILQSIAEEDGDYSVHSYSGRGMYGSSCLAVSFNGSLGNLFSAVLMYTTTENRDDLAEAFEGMSQDSMGRGKVVYFPGVEYVPAATEEDEDSEPDSGDIENAEV